MSELNFWEQWRAGMIAGARSERDRSAKSYSSLKNKNCEYARSIALVLAVREQVLLLWERSPTSLPPSTDGGGV